jgi:hypothetical protein
MLIQIFLLLVTLSLEATIGLPLFFLYFTYRIINLSSDRFVLPGLWLMAFLLAIFYSLSWPVMGFLLLIFHLIWQAISSKPAAQLASFIALCFAIFYLADLQLNYFYLVHLGAFLLYFYKAKFRNYAS